VTGRTTSVALPGEPLVPAGVVKSSMHTTALHEPQRR
jgi:hypothetical protein